MKRILVTGGCGFIGSHFVRRMLTRHAGLEVVNLDALTYAGNPAQPGRRRRRSALPLRARLDRRPRRGRATARRGLRRDRQLRRRDPRRPLDPRRAATSSTTNVLGTHVAARRTSASTAAACCTSRPTRSTATSSPASASTRDRRAASLVARTRPRKAGGDLQVLAYVRTYGVRRADHARLEHLRAVPVSREDDPAVHHNLLDGQPRAGVRRRPPGARLHLRRGPLRRHRASCSNGRRGRGLQRRRRPRDREPRDDAPAARADRAATSPRPPRRRPARATTAATRSTAPSCARSAGPRRWTFAEGLRRTVEWYREQARLVGADQARRGVRELQRPPVRIADLTMPTLIQHRAASRRRSAPKLIEEYVGHVNNDEARQHRAHALAAGLGRARTATGVRRVHARPRGLPAGGARGRNARGACGARRSSRAPESGCATRRPRRGAPSTWRSACRRSRRRACGAIPSSVGNPYLPLTTLRYPERAMQGSGHAPPRFAVAVLLAAVLGVFAGPARADETFTFAGHGYGHGVGMPQYGAEGYALAGGSYQQILSLYYPARRSAPRRRPPRSACCCRAGRRASRSRAQRDSSRTTSERRQRGRAERRRRDTVERHLLGLLARRCPARGRLGRSGAALARGREPRPARGQRRCSAARTGRTAARSGSPRRRAGSPRSTSFRWRTTCVGSSRARCPRAGAVRHCEAQAVAARSYALATGRLRPAGSSTSSPTTRWGPRRHPRGAPPRRTRRSRPPRDRSSRTGGRSRRRTSRHRAAAGRRTSRRVLDAAADAVPRRGRRALRRRFPVPATGRLRSPARQRDALGYGGTIWACRRTPTPRGGSARW